MRLSRTEKCVAELMCKGLSSKQIAFELIVSINTVFAHRKKIYSKLNVHGILEFFLTYKIGDGGHPK